MSKMRQGFIAILLVYALPGELVFAGDAGAIPEPSVLGLVAAGAVIAFLLRGRG